MSCGARIAGEVDWQPEWRMADILRAAGLRVDVGKYSIRIEDCEHFVFQEYGGDICEPCVDADSESVDRLIREAEVVSRALAKGDVRHRFEVIDDNDLEVAYFHHDWPKQIEGTVAP
jgi:hypothetical protein